MRDVLRRGRIIRDDALGMLRTVLRDVGDRRSDVIDDAHGDDGVKIFRIPVLLGRRLYPGIGVRRGVVGENALARRNAEFVRGDQVDSGVRLPRLRVA